jgi:hypothetical protein
MSWMIAELPHNRKAIINTVDVVSGLSSERPYVFNELLFDMLCLLNDEELKQYNISCLDKCLCQKYQDKVLVQLERRYRILSIPHLGMLVSELKTHIKGLYPHILIDFIGDQAHVHGKVDIDEMLGDNVLVGVIGLPDDLCELEEDLFGFRVYSGFRCLFGGECGIYGA